MVSATATATEAPAVGRSHATAQPEHSASTTSAPVMIRPGRAADHPFVLNSWLKQHRRSEAALFVPRQVFFERHHDLAERILARAELRVAAAPDDEDAILGWLVCEAGGAVVHYCYVKAPLRRLGIARLLMRGVPGDFRFSHRPGLMIERGGASPGKPGIRLMGEPPGESALKRCPRAIYDPYLVTEPAPRGPVVERMVARVGS